MRPTKLVLHNYCQHRDLELVFVPGMNMIRGPNGCGKSNLVDALCMAVSCESNNILRKSDKKTDNITVGEEKGWIHYEFEHEGLPGAIDIKLSRNYRTDADVLAREIEWAKQQVVANGEGAESELSDEVLQMASFKPRESVSVSLVWGAVPAEGEEDERLKIKGSTKVLEWVSRIVGLQPSAIKSTFFPDQGNIDNLISGDPEARYRALAEQAGIVLCQKIYRELGDEISTQPAFEGVEERLKELEAELAAADHRLAEAERKMAEASAKAFDPEPLRQTITAYQQASTVRKRQAENLGKRAELETQHKEAHEAVEASKVKGLDLKEKFEAAEQAHESAKTLIAMHEEQEKALVKRNEITQELTEAQAKKDALPPMPPEPAPKLRRRTELETELGSLSQKINDRRHWLSQFADGTCPTCKRPFEDGAQLVDQYNQEIQELETASEKATSELLQVRADIQEWEDHTRELGKETAALTARIDTLVEQLQALPTFAPEQRVTEGQLMVAKEAVALYQTLRGELAQEQENYREKAKAFREAEAELKVVDGLLAAARTDIENSPTEEAFKAASDKFAEYQLVDQEVRDAGRELAEAKGAQATKAKDTEDERQRFERMRPVRDWLGLLGQVRDLYHRNGLPRDAVLWYANRLVEQTNSYLKEFDEGFSMTMGDDMSFLAVFEDGAKIQPAGRLSRGEKNMLNLSIRFAYADLYPSAFRFLELDEVEVHLDQENVSRLPYIFEKVKGLARNRGLVVLFISHHPTLSEIADHVIDL